MYDLNITQTFGTMALLGILIFIFVIAFIMWMIKKSVKNAIEEILENDVYNEDLKYTIADGVLLALEQYNNGNQKERPTE